MFEFVIVFKKELNKSNVVIDKNNLYMLDFYNNFYNDSILKVYKVEL